MCSSCFDLQENLFLKKDGSGSFSFIIEMSQFKPMMSMFEDIGSTLDVNGKKNDKQRKNVKKSPDEKLTSTFELTKSKLLNTDGISNVKIIEDTTNFSFGISFNFKHMKALNEAMNKLFEDDSATTDTTRIKYFEFKDNQLTRFEVLDSKSIMGKSVSMSPTKNESSPLFDVEKLFGTVTYSTNYEFENKVSSIQNENSLLTTNMKKVTLKVFPFVTVKDSMQKKQSIGNIILFK